MEPTIYATKLAIKTLQVLLRVIAKALAPSIANSGGGRIIAML